MEPDCDKCQDHSGHRELLKSHTRRHDDNDNKHKSIWSAVNMKISRWVFIVTIGVFGAVMGYQTVRIDSMSAVVVKMDKNFVELAIEIKGHLEGMNKRDTIYTLGGDSK